MGRRPACRCHPTRGEGFAGEDSSPQRGQGFWNPSGLIREYEVARWVGLDPQAGCCKSSGRQANGRLVRFDHPGLAFLVGSPSRGGR